MGRRRTPPVMGVEVVRVGDRRSLFADIYYRLINGSWLILLSLLGGSYVLANLVFAALYLVDPSSVSNLEHGSLASAFFFSIQTMATIGYGVMAPRSLYAHVLVAIEAAVGLAGFAMATGLMFAKFARPRANVLFSEVAVVTRFHGVRCLMFRVANARGNEVVEASMSFTALIDEVSPEGIRLRRMHDLKLLRERSPMFYLSWLVIHPLDEQSPICTLGPDELVRKRVALFATLTGFDASFAQTVHARHTYQPADLRWGERFADVLSNLSDDRMQIDLSRFHQTEPETAS